MVHIVLGRIHILALFHSLLVPQDIFPQALGEAPLGVSPRSLNTAGMWLLYIFFKSLEDFKNICGGRNSRFHVADLGLIPSIPYSP